MRKIHLVTALLFMATFAFAQARQTTADYNKTMQPAIETEIPFPEKTVLKSLVDKMEKRGYKGKEVKGYTVFKGVNMPEIGPDAYDLYFKTDRKKKDKDVTILTMLISTGNEKFISEGDNVKVLDDSKTFLNNHSAHAAAYDLELQIKDQDEATTKADKKYNNLVDDGKDLVKKKEKLEKEIEENLKKQEEQKNEAAKQLQIANTLKAKRKQ